MAFLLAQVASGFSSLAPATGVWGSTTRGTFLILVLVRESFISVTLLVLFMALLLPLPFPLTTLIVCCCHWIGPMWFLLEQLQCDKIHVGSVRG